MFKAKLQKENSTILYRALALYCRIRMIPVIYTEEKPGD